MKKPLLGLLGIPGLLNFKRNPLSVYFPFNFSTDEVVATESARGYPKAFLVSNGQELSCPVVSYMCTADF